jgi:hypothetical protein
MSPRGGGAGRKCRRREEGRPKRALILSFEFEIVSQLVTANLLKYVMAGVVHINSRAKRGILSNIENNGATFEKSFRAFSLLKSAAILFRRFSVFDLRRNEATSHPCLKLFYACRDTTKGARVHLDTYSSLSSTTPN